MDHFAFSIAWSLFPPTNNSSFSEIIPPLLTLITHTRTFIRRRCFNVEWPVVLHYRTRHSTLTYPLSLSLHQCQPKETNTLNAVHVCIRSITTYIHTMRHSCRINSLYTKRVHNVVRLSSSVLCTVGGMKLSCPFSLPLLLYTKVLLLFPLIQFENYVYAFQVFLLVPIVPSLPPHSPPNPLITYARRSSLLFSFSRLLVLSFPL